MIRKYSQAIHEILLQKCFIIFTEVLNVEEKQVDKVQNTVVEDTTEEEIPDLLEMEEEEEDEEEENVQCNPTEINLHLIYINVFFLIFNQC